MRIAIISAALVALASTAVPALAQSQQQPARRVPGIEDSRLGAISRCMAYYAVLGGMDGTKPVGSDTAAVVKDLGTELYMEAAKHNVTEETIQNAVVAALVSLNMSAKEEGMDKLKAAMEGQCDSLVGQVRGMP